MYVVRIGLTACTKSRSCVSALLLQMRAVGCGQTTASGRELPAGAVRFRATRPPAPPNSSHPPARRPGPQNGQPSESRRSTVLLNVIAKGPVLFGDLHQIHKNILWSKPAPAAALTANRR